MTKKFEDDVAVARERVEKAESDLATAKTALGAAKTVVAGDPAVKAYRQKERSRKIVSRARKNRRSTRKLAAGYKKAHAGRAFLPYKIRRFKRKGKKLLNNKNLPASMATDDAHLNAQEALALGDQGAEEPASMATDDAPLNAQEALALFDFMDGHDVELEHGFAAFSNLTLLHDNLQELSNLNQTLSNIYGEHITRTRRKKLKKQITKSTAVVRKVMAELDYDFDEIYPDAIFVDVDHVDYHGRYLHWDQVLNDPNQPWAALNNE